ncbi:hypothetical protein F4859DRAFT_485470 [Xylaria cf. heliscus]|nr:hypothetical protein F4859DRAFT_485470 [Xylaria cf. heliscus]
MLLLFLVPNYYKLHYYALEILICILLVLLWSVVLLFVSSLSLAAPLRHSLQSYPYLNYYRARKYCLTILTMSLCPLYIGSSVARL